MAIQDKFNRANVIYKITKDIDLKGETLTIPEGCTLDFQGGSLSNGTVVGNGTRIVTAPHIFNNIIIKGDWNIDYLNSNIFKNIHEENVLVQLFALTSNNIYNKVDIQGDFIVSSPHDVNGILKVKSNTDINIKGSISLKANSFVKVFVFEIKNVSNISINGGIIIGDRLEHQGTTGEHGHGIYIYGNCHNISISNTIIKNCWGDGLAIGGSGIAYNVFVDNVEIDYCRRQGISIIGGDNVVVKNSKITNIEGTAPEAAIDIEPNGDTYVNNVILDNIVVNTKKRGVIILIGSMPDNVIANNIKITNSSIISTEDTAIVVDSSNTKNVNISNNTIQGSTGSILLNNWSSNIQIKNNNIVSYESCVLLQSYKNGNNLIVVDNRFEGNLCVGGYITGELHVIKNNSFNVKYGFQNLTNSIVESNIINCEVLCYKDGANNNKFGDNIINASATLFEATSSYPLLFTNNKFNNNNINTAYLYVTKWEGLIFNNNTINCGYINLAKPSIFTNNIVTLTHADGFAISDSKCQNNTIKASKLYLTNTMIIDNIVECNGDSNNSEYFIITSDCDLINNKFTHTNGFLKKYMILSRAKANILNNRFIGNKDSLSSFVKINEINSTIIKNNIINGEDIPLFDGASQTPITIDIDIPHIGSATSDKVANNSYIGLPFFNTETGKPQWYAGTSKGWVDATGAEV